MSKKSFSLKEQITQSYLFQTGQSFTAHKMLVWLTYVWRTATATFFKERVIQELGSHLNRIRFI